MTHDFDDHCVFVRDSTDSAVSVSQDSSSFAIVEHVFAYAIFLHDSVYATADFNYCVCRLPVPSKLNIPLWRSLLVDYDDFIVCDYLDFGWPVGYVRDSLPVSSQQRNHQGALLYPEAVNNYLQTERS